MAKDTQKKSTQITANVGLHYVCYQLSRPRVERHGHRSECQRD